MKEESVEEIKKRIREIQEGELQELQNKLFRYKTEVSEELLYFIAKKSEVISEAYESILKKIKEKTDDFGPLPEADPRDVFKELVLIMKKKHGVIFQSDETFFLNEEESFFEDWEDSW